MTIINKEVTRTTESTKTVQTCDICGLSEIEIPDEEDIKKVMSGLNVDIEYILFITKFEEEDAPDKIAEEWTETFDDIHEAKLRAQEIDMDFHSISRESEMSINWDLHVDACSNCRKMMFGAFDGHNFNGYEKA